VCWHCRMSLGFPENLPGDSKVALDTAYKCHSLAELYSPAMKTLYYDLIVGIVKMSSIRI